MLAALHALSDEDIPSDKSYDERHPPNRQLDRGENEHRKGYDRADRQKDASSRKRLIKNSLRNEPDIVIGREMVFAHLIRRKLGKHFKVVGQIARSLAYPDRSHDQPCCYREKQKRKPIKNVAKWARIPIEDG